MTDWNFFTNHAHVLLLLCHEPDLRVRDIAGKVGITERAVQKIVHDLEQEGYLQIEKAGRRNHYEPHLGAHLRHPLEEGCTVAQLLAALDADG